jgi:hypothetical protein
MLGHTVASTGSHTDKRKRTSVKKFGVTLLSKKGRMSWQGFRERCLNSLTTATMFSQSFLLTQCSKNQFQLFSQSISSSRMPVINSNSRINSTLTRTTLSRININNLSLVSSISNNQSCQLNQPIYSPRLLIHLRLSTSRHTTSSEDSSSSSHQLTR